MRVIKCLLLLPILLSHCSPSYSEYSESDNETENRFSDKPLISSEEFGKCHVKAHIPDLFQEDSIDCIVYTGVLEDEEKEVEIEDITVTLKPATTKWVRKPVDENCLTDDPNCLVPTLVEVPAEILEYTSLIDTSLSKNFEVKQYKIKKLVKKGGYTEWVEIICKSRLTTDVIVQIQNQLLNLGYNLGPSDDEIERTRKPLIEFQQVNSLPVGHFDIKSMEMLGIL